MSAYLALNDPFAHPAHFLGLELIFVACFALTLRDVVLRWRAGDRFAAFQWLAAFTYGVFMELIAFNFLDNYDHGQFTVQLYHGKLPFYVICLYPVFLYTGLRVAQRWQLRALPEALLAGLAMCLIDVPFDIAGVDAGWWRWSTKDANLAVRWLGVPVTSYYWYCVFGFAFALLCRFARPRLKRRSFALQAALAPLVGGGIIVLGSLLFLPFHGLKALGVRDDAVVAAHLALCAVVALFSRARTRGPSLGALAAAPLLVGVWSLVVLLWVGAAPHLNLKLASVIVALAGSLRLLLPITPAPVADLAKEGEPS